MQKQRLPHGSLCFFSYDTSALVYNIGSFYLFCTFPLAGMTKMQYFCSANTMLVFAKT